MSTLSARVLHVTDRLTDRGGAYRHLAGVVAWQVAQGMEVRLAAGVDDGTLNLSCPVSIVPPLAARSRARVDLTQLMTEASPDVVHVHTVMNPTALEWIGAMSSVVKVLTVQDHRVFCPGMGKWTLDGHPCTERMSQELCEQCFTDEAYYRDIYALTRERYDVLESFRVVVLSRYMAQELALTENSVHVIPPFVHGLDLDARPSGEPCILFVGRLVEAKGVAEAVEVCKRSGLNLPLVLAGAGPAREACGDAEVLGWVSHPRMAGLYRRAVALVMTPRWQEPFGIAGLEAMTLGTPVAGWESGGMREWHPGPLAPWGDIDAVAAQLRSIVGSRVAEPTGFDEDTLMKRLLAIYGRDVAVSIVDRERSSD